LFCIDKDASTSDYVDVHHGLYPAPLGRNAKSNTITKVRQKFKFLGKFMAKALMDSRMVNFIFFSNLNLLIFFI
jgi:E3 ubiquitin-protein ligase TRIP12